MILASSIFLFYFKTLVFKLSNFNYFPDILIISEVFVHVTFNGLFAFISVMAHISSLTKPTSLRLVTTVLQMS